VEKKQTKLETSGEDVKTTLETSGEDVKTTLETSVELDITFFLTVASLEPASSALTTFLIPFRAPAVPKTTLETSGEDVKLHSKRVEKM
jgi:hypothetical protein